MWKHLGKLVLTAGLCAALLGFGACEDSNAASGTLRYMRWAGTQEALDFQTLVDAYMKLNPKVTIETEFLPWSAYWEKVRNGLLSGEVADVISLAGGEAAPYITKRAFMKLNDLDGAMDLLEQMQPGTRDVVKFQGELYAMPVGVGVRTMIYNKALLDAAGIPYPSSTEPLTWDEFIALGKKLTKKNGNEFVQYAAHFHKQEMYEALVNQKGGRVLDDYTHPTKVLLNSAEGVAGLQLMTDLIKQDILPPHTGEWAGAWGTPDSAVVTGKVAFMQAGPWGLGPLDQENIKYGACPLPQDKFRANRGYINSLAISKDTKNAKAAWAFIKWMCGAEGQLEFTKTGDLPANSKALESALQKEIRPREIMAAYYSELPYTIFGPMLPSSEFNALLDDALTPLFQLKETPAKTAARIEQEGDQIIKAIFEE